MSNHETNPLMPLRMKLAKFCLLLVCAFVCQAVSAQVPQLINYQGRISVGGASFNGTGLFKFGSVTSTDSLCFWSNDGSSVAGSEPIAAVSFGVTNGFYAVLLGDTTVTNMTGNVDPSIFANNDVRLRVWFNDGTNGSQQ